MTGSDWRPTACILCECNCGIEVRLADRHIVQVRGDRKHPVSRGYVCEKPARLDYYQNDPERLRTPLRRRPDGTHEPISWEAAIAEVAERLAAVRDRHGGKSIFYYGGGGQANHLPGAYATATRAALGSVYRSSALAQEKTGEMLVAGRMLGKMTRADFDHCDVAFFLGKNPWQSHSIPRARVTLKAIAKDPARTLIVVDPRRTETAALADIHLQVRPGTDAWLLLALLNVIVEEDRLDRAFLARADGLETVLAALRRHSLAECCAVAGVPEAQVREAARKIAGARALATFEDLGVQMNRNSTVVSWLHHLLWLFTGQVGRPGTRYTATPLIPWVYGDTGKKSPVLGERIVGGLVPCNVIAEEVLADHPARYRAMIIEAANPAHSLADSPRFREAMAALEISVVIDVAYSETARLADYVLPATTQMEKAEASFFNFEFPDTAFHLRRAILAPPDGPLPEAEIHARLCEALGALDAGVLTTLRGATGDLTTYALTFLQTVAMGPHKGLAAVLLYRSLGEVLPPDAKEGSVLFGLCLQAATRDPVGLARAGFGGNPVAAACALFTALLDNPSGVVFSRGDWSEVSDALATVHLALPELIAALDRLEAPATDAAWPFALSAGERRAFTANTILRDPAWRSRDGGGALRIHPEDAARLGLGDGSRARVETRRGAAEAVVELDADMRPGHIALPNGLGLTRPDGTVGVAPNELTSAEDRDPWVGTPWHKSVPARVSACG